MRTFIFFNSSEKALLDYSQLVETSQDTLRLSLDGTKTFVSYQSETMPESIQSLNSYIGPLTLEETKSILQTAEWLPPAPTT
jgi:hypothetical protein